MYTGLHHTHEYVRYLILVALAFVLFRSFLGWFGRKPYEKMDNIGASALLGLSHLQLLTGLILYFGYSVYVKQDISAITDPELKSWVRYFKMEHISMMVLAVALIQIGRIASKKAADPIVKHKKMAIYTAIAALLIVVTLAMKGLLIGSLASTN